jgi:anthranilate phosphoribosyltransferase
MLGAKKAFVVCGHDGLDEISVCTPTRVSELKDGQIRTYDISPEAYFGQSAEPGTMLGGVPDENAKITQKILAGEKGSKRNVVLINAAVALMAAGKAGDIAEGIRLAETSIDSGAARDKLDSLITFTRENG